jgi:hypothetical protein
MDFLDKYPHLVFPEPNSGCWLCVSRNNWHGYARVRVGHRVVGAHRISYELSAGPIPERFEIDHLCRVTCCVNPEHLEAVTQDENKRRQARAIDAANGFRCRNGHLRQGEGIYMHPDGTLRCRKCAQTARLRYIQSRRSAA